MKDGKPNYQHHYTLSGHTMSLSSLKFSPDGKMLASGGAADFQSVLKPLSDDLYSTAADKLIKLWNAYTGDILKTLSGHREGINDVAWSKDNEHIASASDDKTIRIWSVETVRSSYSFQNSNI